MNSNRITALVCAILLTAASLISCNSSNNETTNENKNAEENVENNNNVSDESEVQDSTAGLYAYNWKYSDDEVMFTIGGHPITFAEYRYIAMNYKSSYDNGDDSYWTQDAENDYKTEIVNYYKPLVGAQLLANNVYGLTLDETDEEEIQNYISYCNYYYGESAFNLSYLSEEIFTKILEYEWYTNKLLKANVSEEEYSQYIKDNDYVHVQHVLIKTVDDDNQEYSQEVKEEKLALANEISQRAKNGEDFYSLVEEYGEDPGMNNNPEGYTFTHGKMVEEFENESFRLSEGEISEPIETSYGYHIIKKLPLNTESLQNQNFDDYWTIVSAIAQDDVTNEITGFLEGIEVEYTDAFNSLTMLNIGVLKEQPENESENDENQNDTDNSASESDENKNNSESNDDISTDAEE